MGNTPLSRRTHARTANTNLITSFYDAFEHRNHEGMNACCHSDIHFSDPVFTDLHGTEGHAMWHMPCKRGAGLDVAFSDVHAVDGIGRAHWEERYTLSKGGREIHNVVDAHFEFRDHLIDRHRDDFDLYARTRMAFGPTGTLLGWNSPFQNRVRSTAMNSLRRFMADHSEYGR